MDVITSSTEFTRTRACALGGEVVVTGTRSRTRDTETRTGTMDVSATRTFVECARPLDESDVTVPLNGAVTLTAHREWDAGQWNGMQELTLVGSVDWATDDDRSGTCEIDILAGIDPVPPAGRTVVDREAPVGGGSYIRGAASGPPGSPSRPGDRRGRSPVPRRSRAKP
ncbi:MAG: hypothetical protein R6U63_16390 [Longimicrobiales bacterium]